MIGVSNPKPGGRSAEASPTEVRFREAARATRAAAPAWQRAGVEKRLAVVAEAGERLHARRAELEAAMRGDGFSGEMAAFWSEWILRAADPKLLARYARGLVRWFATDGGGELLVRRPDGVVLLVPPANAPTLNASPLFQILLAGNGVVVRAPERGRGAALLVDDCVRPALARAGFAAEVATVLPGKSRDVVAALLPGDAVDTVVWFGKSSAGEELAAEARRAGKKLILELEGSDHMVVWRDADLAGAVASTETAWHLSTQPCPVPKHLLVHGAVFDAFVDGMRATLPAAARTIQADPQRGRLVPVARPDDWAYALDELRAIGTVCAGGHRMAADGAADERGAWLAPTIVAVDAAAVLARPLRCFTDEIAWPLVPVVRFTGDDERVLGEMCRVLADMSHGLRASVWTRSPSVMARFAVEVGCVGLLRFNDDHARPPAYASAWGGTRKSGGPNGELHFFWEKTTHLQAIDCRRLSTGEVDALVQALGCASFDPRAGGGQ